MIITIGQYLIFYKPPEFLASPPSKFVIRHTLATSMSVI